MAKTTQKKSTSKKAPEEVSANTEAFTGQMKPDFISSTEELFTSEIKDALWAENHLVKSLPKMISASGNADLKQALTQHLEVTRQHASRLEEVLGQLGEDIVAKKCDAMEGLTMSGEHMIENTITGTEVRDTGIIMSGLKVENFEITSYTGLVNTANKLGKSGIADLLQLTLDEEIEAANILSGILEPLGTSDQAY